MEEHVHNALTSSSAVAAPSDVAHLLREGSGIIREGSGIIHTPSATELEVFELNLDGRAEVYLETSAPTDSVPAPDPEALTEIQQSETSTFQ